MMPILMPAGVDDHGRAARWANHRAVGGVVDQVGGEERKLRLRRARLERAAWIVVADAGVRADHRAEVELVVADRGRRVAERVVGGDDVAPSRRFDSSVPWNMSPRVDQEHRAAVWRERRAGS